MKKLLTNIEDKFYFEVLDEMKKAPNKDGRSYDDEIVHGLLGEYAELRNKHIKGSQEHEVVRMKLIRRTDERNGLETDYCTSHCSSERAEQKLRREIRKLKKELENAKGTTTNSDTPSTTTDS